MQQLLGIAIEEKIDTAYMNAKVVRLREEYAICDATRNNLMGMTGDKYRRLRKFRSQCHDRVRKIIAAAARL